MPIFLLFLILIGCKKESNSSGGFIKANVDGTLYNCTILKGGAGYNGNDYGVTYGTSENATYDAFSFTLKDRDLLSAPYTFTNNYNGAGVQIFFRKIQPVTPTLVEYSANNWSQSTTNTGFTVTVTEISNGMIKGTFSGGIRKYNPQSQPCCTYTQKQITNGEFEVPYEQ